MKPLFFALTISACASFDTPRDVADEAVDQSAHFALGYALAKELTEHSTNALLIEAAVMEYARAREALQMDSMNGDGVCGENCQRDLDFWLAGVRQALKEEGL